MAEQKKKKKRLYKNTYNPDCTSNKLHSEKYGFIEIENPEYYKKDNGCWAVPEFLLRKPTPKERKEIIVNYIIAHNGKSIDMDAFAEKLCISKRLMLMILKQLREEGLIEVVHTYTETGKQRRNKYRYIGPPCKKYGSGLTLNMLFDVENKAGFRDWDWEDFKYFREGFWNEFEGLDDYKIGHRRLRREYLQRARVSESFGAEKAKYFVLKYSHWISNKRNEPTPPNHIKLNHLTGETYDDRPGSLSADGVKKYELVGLNKIFAFALFGVPFGAEFNREKDNPQIKLFHLRTEEDYITFSYWGDNCVHFTWDYWDGREEHLQLIGEFTSK